MFKVKAVFFKESIKWSMFHDNVLSLFFFNVYLISLDQFIEELTLKEEKAKKSFCNIKFFNENISKPKQKGVGFVKFSLKKKVRSPNFFRIHYVRYDDAFLLGLRFEKKLAEMIVFNIQTFIKSDLHLDFSDFSLNCCDSEMTCFLSFKIIYLKHSKKLNNVNRLNKVKASLQRKKITESQKYSKLVEHINFKIHKKFVESARVVAKTVFKQLRLTNFNEYKTKLKILHVLKLSLYQIESAVLLSATTPNICKVGDKSHHLIALAEQYKDNGLVTVVKK